MEILLAAGSAISYGISDFVGGILSRRMHVLVVLLFPPLVGIPALLIVVGAMGDAFSSGGFVWGLAAGVAGVFGSGMLYKGLAIGRMGVVMPIAGVLSAGLPVVFGLAIGEQPGPLAMAGIVLGLVAVVIVTRTPEQAATKGVPTSALYAFGAGVGFAVFFILTQRAPADSGLWPTLAARVAVLVVIGALVAIRRIDPRPPKKLVLPLAGQSLVITAADALFLLATREGMLSIVAVIASLYPAVTVALAAVILRERIARGQLVGLLAAGVAVVLIALR